MRYRAKLVALRSGPKAQVHAVSAKEGVRVPVSDPFGRAGQVLLDGCPLGEAYAIRLVSLRHLIEIHDRESEMLHDHIAKRLQGHRGYRAVQAIPGVGPVLGAVFVAEIGDVGRFSRPDQLACWAGVTPRHRESDTTVRRGSPRAPSWCAGRPSRPSAATGEGKFLQDHHDRIAKARNSPGIARVAAARKLLHLVFYGLRDGEVRCLAAQGR